MLREFKSQIVGKKEESILNVTNKKNSKTTKSKTKQNKNKQMWEIKSAKQGRCHTLWQKIREKKDFQKVQSQGN